MARLPVDPRLGRMLIEARKEHCLAEMLPIIAALESNDPRERPAEKTREADAAHARWKDGESDFIGILRLWHDLAKFRDDRGRWQRNALRKFCGPAFLNARRVMEWANVARRTRRSVGARVEAQARRNRQRSIRRCRLRHHPQALLAGVPRQFGVWDREIKSYRSANGGFFAVFPGSGLFALPKRFEWVMAHGAGGNLAAVGAAGCADRSRMGRAGRAAPVQAANMARRIGTKTRARSMARKP